MERKDDGLRPEDLIGDPEHPNSPAQMLEALIAKAVDTGSMRPLGQAMGGLQAQLDQVFGMFQYNIQRIGHITSMNSMQVDTLRMAFLALIDFLVEKKVMTQEEWEVVYERDVQKKMEERIAAARKQREDAAKGAEEAPEPCSCGADCEEACEGKCAEEVESDVVLPSEKEGAVVHFPNKTE